MRFEDICALPVSSIAAEDAALLLWTTGPMMPLALHLLVRWGFYYKTVAFTWTKTCRKQTDRDFIGMGHSTRTGSEFCLLGTRGRLRRRSASVRQVIRRPVMRHSQKPPEVRDRIVELYGDLPRVELFARDRVPGWSAWGNEIESDITLYA
jgi:site-specific DNA-methyltransferase (adenine-specific)